MSTNLHALRKMSFIPRLRKKGGTGQSIIRASHSDEFPAL